MITGLNHITLSVSDLETSFRFYTDLLGFSSKAKWENGAYLECGGLWLALIADDRIRRAERPDYSHVAFSCNLKDFEAIQSKLEAAGYPAWQENKSEGDSYYFNDPDNHKLEIHVGDLESRLKSMKESPWAAFTFFE